MRKFQEAREEKAIETAKTMIADIIPPGYRKYLIATIIQQQTIDIGCPNHVVFL